MPVRLTLLHRIALVSFVPFRKNLGNLGEFFGQMVYRPPPPPPPPLAKKLPVRLCLDKLFPILPDKGEDAIDMSVKRAIKA